MLEMIAITTKRVQILNDEVIYKDSIDVEQTGYCHDYRNLGGSR